MTRRDVSRHLVNARLIAAIFTAFTFPISTSGQAIGVGVLAVLALVTLDGSRFVDTIRRPAAFVPALLAGLVLVGVTWSMQPASIAIKSVEPYIRLLLIPLLMACAFTPRDAIQIGLGFLAGCGVVLVLSLVSIVWTTGPWSWFRSSGIPFKDNAVQSGCFVLCAFGLVIATTRLWSADRKPLAVAAAVVAALFLGDIFLIFVSKTSLLVAAALLVLLMVHAEGWRRMLLVLCPVVIVVGLAVLIAKPERLRVNEVVSDINVTTNNAASPDSVSSAARLDFWHKAIGFIRAAPLIGYGTGSIRPLYQTLEATQPSPYGSATHDPHNQMLHVMLQVGVLGGVLLVAMWIAHAMLFAGRDIPSVLGQAIVIQSVIGCLFNSHLAAVTQGMLYCFAVGILGAVVPMTRTALYRGPVDAVTSASASDRAIGA